jgi:hypothetical protein
VRDHHGGWGPVVAHEKLRPGPFGALRQEGAQLAGASMRRTTGGSNFQRTNYVAAIGPRCIRFANVRIGQSRLSAFGESTRCAANGWEFARFGCEPRESVPESAPFSENFDYWDLVVGSPVCVSRVAVDG